jgi:hypothetical protein
MSIKTPFNLSLSALETLHFVNLGARDPKHHT